MPDFPNELVEAAAKALRTSEIPITLSPTEGWVFDADESARAVLAAVLPLIEQRVRREPPDEEAVLRWECESCGWHVSVPMPGYAGDGHYHYGAGNQPCGPLVARREGFIRARPGELVERSSQLRDETESTAPAGLNTDPSESAVEQRVIDRLAREAGEPERHVVWLCAGCDVCHPPDGSPREQRYPCAPDGGSPSCGGALVVLAEDAERWVACGVAAERARWEAKQRPRITHGRHCTCTPCAREDWTNPALAPCGMHGKDCPQEYAPLGAAGDPVPAAALSPEQTTATEPEGSGDAAR